jgi:hypothetical protein
MTLSGIEPATFRLIAQCVISYIYIYIISWNVVLVGKLIFACYEEIYGPNVAFKWSYILTPIPSQTNRVQSSIIPTHIPTTLPVLYSLTLSPKHLSMPTASGYSRFNAPGHLLTCLGPFVAFLSLFRYLPNSSVTNQVTTSFVLVHPSVSH